MNRFTSESPNSYSAEKQLIENIQLGNLGALEKLYDLYACVLLGLISKIIVNEKIAEDVFQQSFMNICKTIKSYDSSKESLLVWMLKITRKMALNTVEHIEQKQGMAIRVTHTFVSAFDLIYFKGYSYAAVAKELDIPISDLKIKIRAELKHLNRVVIK